MRIALDAMGSDTCPAPDVEGAVLAAREFGDTLYLVGDEARIKSELARHDTRGLAIEVVPASEVVTMTDKPGTVGKSKPDSSMHVGLNLVKDGRADAFVTAGNTGAALSIATLFTLRRITGVKRPALSAVVPIAEQRCIVLDVGANADCKPEWLLQFAIMGKLYAQYAVGMQQPRIGLLANGEEDEKGNTLIHETAALLRATPSLNFIGNIEPKDMVRGAVDVVVCDGFVGNVWLKTIETSTRLIVNLLREELTSTPLSKIGALLSRPAFRRVQKRIDPFEIGGAPLLGVNGVVIIGHGRSNAYAIKNAVREARKAVSGGLIDAISAGIAESATTSSSQGG